MGTVQLIISTLTFIVALAVAVYGVYQYRDSNRPDLVIHPVDAERTDSKGDGTYSSPPETAVIFVLTNIGKNPPSTSTCGLNLNGRHTITSLQNRMKTRKTNHVGKEHDCIY